MDVIKHLVTLLILFLFGRLNQIKTSNIFFMDGITTLKHGIKHKGKLKENLLNVVPTFI